jgi:DNA topoisomerase-1
MGATAAHETLSKPEVFEKPARSKKISTKRGKKKTNQRTASARVAPRSGRRRGKKLVIVESPAKARSVGHFLGGGYVVKASKGHIRDLLVTQLSVDVENDFEPKYRVPNEKRQVVNDLKSAADDADEVFLATDPDREGEAIAWHLIAATDLDESKIKRVVFHEITKPAIEHAFQQPRSIDMSLVNAQQARRILDRLVGYNLSEILWDRVRNRLSAGRVQSIAARLVVEREREIESFVPQEYWTLDVKLKKQTANGEKDNKPFVARVIKYKGEEVAFSQESEVRPHLHVLEKSRYVVSEVKRGVRQRKPSPPFTTSTLQQEASRRLGFNAQRTMRTAQQLYEGIDIGTEGAVGLITYMRTDSLNISEQAQAEARQFIGKRFGKDYLPSKAPQYKTKTKGAQEAHEAVRPTSVMREPDTLTGVLTRDQQRLYKLIWERFVASQMENAVYNTVRVDIVAGLSANDMPYLLRVSGSTIQFPGFLALYEDSRDEDAQVDEDEGRILPELNPNERLTLLQLLPEQHFTQPPPRYTEATLVRTLEEFGIGRPSTYAPTVAVIQDRDYVTKEDKRLVPTETGKIVNDLLMQFFPDIMNYQFTAHMEDELDSIAEGDLEWQPMLHEFYAPFAQRLEHARNNMPKMRQEERVGRDCPVSGHPLVIRYGRWGKFIGCSDYPNCRYTEPYLERTGVSCPECGTQHGGELVERRSKKGRTFYGCSRYPDCQYFTWRLPGRRALSEEESSEVENESAQPDLSAG